MRRMVFIAPGRLEWEEAPAPTLQGQEEAIVRPFCMGRCDLDRLYLAGRMPLKAGEPIGHEIFGEVVELGEAAARVFREGQRVIVPAQISCGACAACLRGQTGRCERVPLGASYGMGRAGGYGGGVSDLVRVPFATGMLTPLPDVADPIALMGLADMATDAWRAVGPQLAARPGASVLVVSAAVPVIGLYAAALARTLGAGRVAYVDADAERRATAAAYGAEVASAVEGVAVPPFDIVVDAGSDPDLLLAAIRVCAPAATLTSVAPPLVSPPLPLAEIYYKGLSWEIGRPNCRHGHAPVLDAWARCGFDPGQVGPKRFRYEDAIEAWLDPALYVAVARTAAA